MMNCIQISRGVNKISMIIQLCSCLLNVLGKDSVNFDFWDFGFWAVSPLLADSCSQSTGEFKEVVC